MQVVKKCNDGAKRMQQTEQMCHLARNLEFKVKVGKLIERKKITTVHNNNLLSEKALMYLFRNFIKFINLQMKRITTLNNFY